MLFDPEAVANLKRILDAVPDVRIVVESSWKVRGLDELRLMWAERGLPGTLYDITPTIFCEELLTADLSDPDSIRKVEGLAKGKEIRAWLRRQCMQQQSTHESGLLSQMQWTLLSVWHFSWHRPLTHSMHGGDSSESPLFYECFSYTAYSKSLTTFFRVLSLTIFATDRSGWERYTALVYSTTYLC